MIRRVFIFLLAVLILVGAGIGVYGLVFHVPRTAQIDPPYYDDDGAQPPPTEEVFEQLARADAIAMLEKCLSRYAREVHGFRTVLHKRERINGDLYPPAELPREQIELCVQNDPLAVRMVWQTRARKDLVGATPAGTLYPFVDAKNPAKVDRSKMAVWRPDAWTEPGKYKEVDPKGDLARTAARYSLKETGFDKAMLRTLDAWKKARDRGDAKPVYITCGPAEEVGGRVCHVIRRECPHPEADSFALDEARPTDSAKIKADGFDRVTIWIDAKHWLQVGTRLERHNGEIVAEYFFRDLQLNPEFPANTFTPAEIKIPLPKK